MSYAFASRADYLAIPRNLGLLDWVAEEAARMGQFIAHDENRKLQHLTIFLRSRYDRETRQGSAILASNTKKGPSRSGRGK